MNSVIRSRILIATLSCALLVISGCSKDSPTAPSFPYDGTWTGTFHDATLSGPFTLTVQQSGTATASGSLNFNDPQAGTVTETISITGTVNGDGHLSGTCTVTISAMGQSVPTNGTATGTLNAGTNTGSGNMTVSLSGQQFNLPWNVTKTE